MSRLRRIAPVLPVRDIQLAVEHYRKLGFGVRQRADADEYAFAVRDDLEIHLARVSEVKPKRNMNAVYLLVDDADALYDEWARAGIEGRLPQPLDTDYGLREGSYLDPDGNLIRFGSPLSPG